MRVLLIFMIVFWFGVTARAETINKEYSYRAYPYHNLSLKDKPASGFNNTVIIGSCFYQESNVNAKNLRAIEKDIFPEGMQGVVFRNCNLDNVYVPPGNSIDGTTSNKKIKVGVDGKDYELDNNLKAVKEMGS